ncbi:hypothetical protein HN51_040953 [Arachis hypogaea]
MILLVLGVVGVTYNAVVLTNYGPVLSAGGLDCLLTIALAQKELQKINMYKAPRDKLVCIPNCCKVIGNLLLNASLASKDSPPGAEDFLPVLIYVTIKVIPIFHHKLICT